jgi:V8-like Glu-specific endopeptidase
METHENRVGREISVRRTIFSLACIAITAPISSGVFATEQIRLDPHREIIDTQKYPWSSVGKVFTGPGRYCTGAVIAPNEFLTAAHCLYDRAIDEIHIMACTRFG